MKVFDENNEPTKEFFVFLKYNKIQNEMILSKRDEALFLEFKTKWKKISESFSQNSDEAKSLFGSIVTMFGYNRHYCSTCGSPIIGKYSKIGGNKIACNDCFESLRIIQQMENIEPIENKSKNKSKNPNRSN